MDVTSVVKQFIEEKLVFGRNPARIEIDEPLFSGLLDSLDILQLVIFLEEQFHIKVQDDELIPQNFETVRKLTEYIQRKVVASVNRT